MQQWAPLFAYKDENMLGDDFEARILQQIGETQQTAVVKAKEVKLTQYLMPLFKAAAVVAIILTLGGALQAPWDNSWDDPREYAVRQQIDTVAAVQPIQAENMSDKADSTSVMMSGLPKD